MQLATEKFKCFLVSNWFEFNQTFMFVYDAAAILWTKQNWLIDLADGNGAITKIFVFDFCVYSFYFQRDSKERKPLLLV